MEAERNALEANYQPTAPRQKEAGEFPATVAENPFLQRNPRLPHSSIPAKEQHTGLVLGIALAQLPHARRQRPLSGHAGRRREDHGSHRPASPPKAGQRRVHRRRFLRKQDERVRLELRLRADSQAARNARHDRSRRPASATSPRFRSSCTTTPTAARCATCCEPRSRRRSTPCRPGATSRARCWPPCNGNQHPQRAVVLDHRRGRLWHSGDLLHDRRREDPRHRHSQIAGRLEPRHHGHLSRLWTVAGHRRLRRRAW